MEKEGKIGDAGGGFAAKEKVFDIAALEGEVGGGDEGGKGGEESGLGIDEESRLEGGAEVSWTTLSGMKPQRERTVSQER